MQLQVPTMSKKPNSSMHKYESMLVQKCYHWKQTKSVQKCNHWQQTKSTDKMYNSKELNTEEKGTKNKAGKSVKKQKHETKN